MRTQKVQCENCSQKSNYLRNMAAGAVAGYALKNALPLTKTEKNTGYDEFIAGYNKSAEKTMADTFEAMKKSPEKTPIVEKFVKAMDESRKSVSSILEAGQNAVKTFAEKEQPEAKMVLGVIKSSGEEVIKAGKTAFKAIAKSVRPTAPFVAAGVAVGAGTSIANKVANHKD